MQDLATERAVLAGIIRYGSNGYDEVADIINTNTFTDEFNQILFNCLGKLIKNNSIEQVDLPSIMSIFNSSGYSNILDNPDERKLLRSIMNFPILQSSVRKLAGKLRKLEIGRNLVEELKSAEKSIKDITGDEPIDHILGLAESPIVELTTKLSGATSSGPTKMGEGIEEYLQYLADNPVEMVGISTGYQIYDMVIGGGLRDGTLNLIGARPKIGKTTFGDNVGLHIAGNLGIPVLNLDTEMTKDSHRIRIMANLSDVTIPEIEKGEFAKYDYKQEKIRKAAIKFKNMPYYYESIIGMPFEEILAIARRWVHRTVGLGNKCVIIYDYLKLMSDGAINKNIQEYQALGFQINALHDFVVKYGIGNLSFIQLNRDGITREDTDVASGSDRQIWTCDSFTLFKKKSDEEIAQDGGTFNRKLVPLVQRHGSGLDDEKDYINMTFKGQFNKIVEGKTRNQLRDEKTKQTEGFVVDVKPDEQFQLQQA
jgi:replicative DNA helicase